MILFTFVACAETLNDCEGWAAPEVTGQIADDEIDEISGIAVSRQHSGWLWVHNDSGDQARVFAMRTDGDEGGAFRLAGVDVNDIEDIALTSDNRLVIGDIGNNKRKRSTVQILLADEPDPGSGGGTISDVEVVTLAYPGDPHDAEALLVDQDDTIYILTKGATSTLFRADLEAGTLSEIATIDPSRWRLDDRTQVTGADVTTDGKVLVRMYDHILVWNLDSGGLPSTFDGTACRVAPAAESQGESLGASTRGFYTASEGEGAAVHEYSRR